MIRFLIDNQLLLSQIHNSKMGERTITTENQSWREPNKDMLMTIWNTLRHSRHDLPLCPCANRQCRQQYLPCYLDHLGKPLIENPQGRHIAP